MARFKCCTLPDPKGQGANVWLNLDLVMSVESDWLGGGSKITFIGGAIDTCYVVQSPEDIFAGPTIDA